MIGPQALSLTSNETKLLKHLDVLQALQAGRARPVLLVVAPTNRCNLSCAHCCFGDRDTGLELPREVLFDAVAAFANLGLKSLEVSGGGEPTLYPHLAEFLSFAAHRSLPVGINTNGTRAEGICWERFVWIRLSLNTLDAPAWREAWRANAREIVHRAAGVVSVCYVVRPDAQSADVRRAVEAAVGLGIPARLAPDCHHPVETIGETLAMLRHEVEALGHPPGVFVSDFNTWLGRREAPCRMHAVKPLLAADGWVYACPSFELAPENPADYADAFRVCRAQDVARYYREPARSYPHGCSFCKYEAQNRMLEAVCAPTRFNEFV